ncbi:hypothetical protein [Caballeronia sp. LZ001]|uniref:hypothetical protein n=1 Tax=Caballeronia sp. LZ001 TaxID=3038553 RepID=UPI00285947AA|nr:hypothetical protein [Caballeronia sp. LZ001]MDR5806352.1 DUF2795 domain-containing protein [Caballeronia sp. LZ001]
MLDHPCIYGRAGVLREKKTARGNEASDEVLGKLDNLTEQEFEMPAEVSEAVGQEE